MSNNCRQSSLPNMAIHTFYKSIVNIYFPVYKNLTHWQLLTMLLECSYLYIRSVFSFSHYVSVSLPHIINAWNIKLTNASLSGKSYNSNSGICIYIYRKFHWFSITHIILSILSLPSPSLKRLFNKISWQHYTCPFESRVRAFLITDMFAFSFRAWKIN